jgi:hypothetical protein
VKINDPRRTDADNYIRDGIATLRAALSKPLDHSDLNTVRAALDGLAVVQRSILGAAVPNDARVAARLRQVAIEVKSCVRPDASIAYADVERAAGIFQAIADRL